jgi:hypothetical protein
LPCGLQAARDTIKKSRLKVTKVMLTSWFEVLQNIAEYDISPAIGTLQLSYVILNKDSIQKYQAKPRY